MADKAKNEKPVKVAEQPAEKAPKEVQIGGVTANDPMQGKNIDERMADLLADHKAMGAR